MKIGGLLKYFVVTCGEEWNRNQHRAVISKRTAMIYLANPYLLEGVQKLVIL
jgi:hypothetical protein